jgi:hypothetical protein
MALVLTVVSPAAALSELPGYFSCPSRPTGIHVVFYDDVDVWAPGDVYDWDWAATWVGRNYAGAIGGGSYDINGWHFSLSSSYVYCQG